MEAGVVSDLFGVDEAVVLGICFSGGLLGSKGLLTEAFLPRDLEYSSKGAIEETTTAGVL